MKILLLFSFKNKEQMKRNIFISAADVKQQ